MSQNPDARLAEALFARIGGDRFNSYLDHPIPSDTDEDVRAVVNAYVNADPRVRESMLEYVVERRAGLIEIFAERLAVLAVRTQSVEPVRLALVAIGMAIPQEDFRYVLKGLAKLDYSAGLLGVDLAVVYEDVAVLLPEASRRFIEDVLGDADRGESFLTGMGYAPKGEGSEFTYVNASPWDDEEDE